MQFNNRSKRFGLLITAASFVGFAAYAAAPGAGERIGNQASATYTNASGDTIKVTSNKVETVVQQIAGVDIAVDTAETGVPGGKVFLPHTITNLGNGADSFTLAGTDGGTGTFDFNDTTIKIFADADRDGVADSTTPIMSTPVLNPNEVFGIIVEAVVPSGATANQTDTISISATSVLDPTNVFDSNTDTITVSTGAVTELQKSMTVSDTSGDGKIGPGDEVIVTITYNNTGLATANDLVVSDVLDARLVYDIAEPATWSDSATVLDYTDSGVTDATNGVNNTIDYSYTDATKTVSFTVNEVPVGRSASVTFKAEIAPGTAAGDIDNVATQTVGGVDFPDSNVPSITVENTFQVTVADRESSTYKADPDDATNLINTGAVSAADDDGSLNDIVTDTTDVSQGATIPFDFVITNHSNNTQTIDVAFANTDFPLGTTFELVGSDGATPVAGPVGPIAPGATTTVTLLATLPSGVGPLTYNATAGAGTHQGYTATISATAAGGGDTNTSTAEFQGNILAAAVDLTLTGANGTGDNGDGNAPTDGGAPWEDKSVDPGTSESYTLDVVNEGPTSDSYDLTVTGLPTGYTATFTLPDGTPITNTGSISAGGTQPIIVTVTPPATATPGTTPFTVAVESAVTGQSDSIVDSITVNTIVDLELTSDQNRQAAPSGIIDIPHVLTNNSNVAITEGALTLTGTLSTFSGTLFWDANSNGIADSTDPVIDNIDDLTDGISAGNNGIAAGDQVSLLLRVQVPSTATAGITEQETISVDLAPNANALTDGDTTNNAVTDTITVVSGDLSLSKLQAIDPLCDGNPGALGAGIRNAEPGQCITYQITAENTGTSNATNVTVTDATPTWTTYTDCSDAAAVPPVAASCTATAATGTFNAPATGNAGTVTADFGTLIPGDKGVLTFTVKIAE